MLASRHRRLPHVGWVRPLLFLLVAFSAFATAADGQPAPRPFALSAAGSLDALAVIGTDGGRYQAPQAGAALRLDATTRRWTAHTEVRGMIGGPYRDSDADVFNFRHAFQNVSPSLDFPEAYLGYRLQHVELRAGLQRFAFGKLDGAPPTDVVNPRDFHDPLVRDFEDAKVGIPSLLASYFPDDVEAAQLSQVRIDVGYIPLAVPARLPLENERWFPPSTSRPALPLDIDLSLSTANDAAPVGFSKMGIFARAGGTWRSIDWEISHYTGPETAPNAALSAEVFSAPSAPTTASSARAILRQTNATLHSTGGSVATSFGGATVRAEGTVLLNRHYLRPVADLVTDVLNDPTALATIQADLAADQRANVPLGDLFFATDAVEWGIGIDYYIAGFLPLLQVNQIVLLENAPRLLVGDPDTRITGSLRKSFWEDRFELDWRSAYTIETGSWLIFPRLAYNVTDALRLRLGYLVLGGSRNSLLGQYKQNDEVVLEGRFSF